MKKFYNFERFDIDYVADAIMFLKADAPGASNTVNITYPNTRKAP